MSVLSEEQYLVSSLVYLTRLSASVQSGWRTELARAGDKARCVLLNYFRSLPCNNYGQSKNKIEQELDLSRWLFLESQPVDINDSNLEVVVPFWSAFYPPRLRNLVDFPFYLTVRGCISALHTRAPVIAIVGTRRPSTEAKTLANIVARDLSRLGAIIVSGLALGIDGIAHEAVVGAEGRGLAVLGGGLDCIYPAQHGWLAKAVCSNKGVIISEYLPQVSPRAHQFLERNRLISGLADLVVVVEAPDRSGSLNTARWAINQGKEVAAFPDTPLKRNAAGTLSLLCEGAHLVRNAEDIWGLLPAWIFSDEHPLKSGKKGIEIPSALSVQANFLAEVLEREGKLTLDDALDILEFTRKELLGAVRELDERGLATLDESGQILWLAI
jgi:DNA protecting protein DprA